MSELVIYPSKFRLFLLAVISLIFIWLGVDFVMWQEAPAVFTFRWIAFISLAGFPLFCVCFLYCCYRLIVPKPAVIVNHIGIFDNAVVFSAGLVKWDEIADVFVYNYGRRRFLGIVTLDTEAFLQRQPVFKKWLMKVGMRLGDPPILIPQSILPMKVDELMSRIQEYRRNHVSYGTP
jgi:hypothetical protein